MAYKEHGMWEILDVLRRIHRGESRRRVAKVTGRGRNTVKHYLEIAEELGWVAEEHEPDERLAAEVAARIRPGPRDPTHRESERRLLPHKEDIRSWLTPKQPGKRGLTLTKVHQFLERQGVRVHYSSLYRFAVKHLDFGRQGRSTVRVADVSPGEVAEVDFGRLGLVPDPDKGGRRTLHALVVTLVYSRHQYVHLTHTQKLPDLIEGLEEAWEYFGGVPARVVIDNLKAAVTKPDRYDPTFQRTFDEYAKYRGFVIDAAVVRHATGKPHVERQVPYVRENFFRGEQFLSRQHAQEEARRWCSVTAGLRIHGTTRKQPLLEFEAHEQGALKPLTKPRFDTPQWGTPSVHPDYHVRFQHALYSVPYIHKGAETVVRGDSKLVRIYVNGECVKTHPRKPKGGRSTDYNDYPPEKSAYAMRDANYQIRQAFKHGEHIGQYAQRLLSGDFPWARLRQAQKLLRLTDKYGADRVDTACRRALGFDLINVNRVQRIIVLGIERQADSEEQQPSSASPTCGQVVQLPLRFLRDPQSFNHHPSAKENADANRD
jgi:transposase